ncbi:serine/threonine protein kinase [Stieleria sp. JC731]|uniref:serine/threonine-protein kinase n=1 Tax=Pirellulaceae TaxID=2691357 RepID=UPI001E40A210|nr:serine/threonine-protein kinase [Stieleria sp. JC731]MCC9603188.1 serine/threonine protein kinase [Stieleria sp. JC731]
MNEFESPSDESRRQQKDAESSADDRSAQYNGNDQHQSADSTATSAATQTMPGDAPTLALPTNGAVGGSLVGSHLATYLILSRLGRGGMADVYAARDMNLDRDVAVKVLRPELSKDRDYIARFRREAKAAAKLNHANIVQIYDVGEIDTRYYIAQELVQGQNLKEYLLRHGPLTPEQAIEVLYGVASALDAAAIEGITHRDIKPENVMWSKSGAVKVADFGLARLGNDNDGSRADLTQAGLTMGTPRYMSPEQVQGRPVDPRSDLYSLGVMMYHLLAGSPPFEADDPLALAFAHVNETPKPLDRVRGNNDVPEWLIAIVQKLLRKDPSERFQSAAELLEVLSGDDSRQGGARRLVGAATATARLQRVADEHRRQADLARRKTILFGLLPIAFCGIGIAVASQMKQPELTDFLVPDQVTKLQTVEEQFLEAVSKDKVAYWEAIPRYFPASESSSNRAYAAKANLQLSRWYMDHDQPRAADDVLAKLTSDPNTDRKYQLVAWAKRVLVADQLRDQKMLDEAKRQFDSLYAELVASKSDAVSMLDRLFSFSEQSILGMNRDS